MFGSTWGQNNQNQQQPQQGTGAFGQPTTTFGGGGAFGAPAQQQQQQQPAANPMFGNLSQPANTPATGGFGAFGGGSTTQANSTFGAKPTTGFGAFGGGGTSAFGGGGGTFGSTPNTAAGSSTGIFGQPANAGTGAFGGGGGAFGGNKTGAFGTTTTPTFGANSNEPATQPVATGSSAPPYSVYNEKDTQNTNLNLQYQAISCMPQYRGTSLEELRVQDYAQNRKTSASTSFTPTTGNAFGTQQPAQATGAFGAPAAQNTSGSIFGGGGATNTATTGGFGAFGQPAAQPATAGAFGAFGQPQQQSQQQPAATGAFGGFGQQPQQQQQASTSVFGGGGAFGAPKPATFGTGGAFGSTGTTGAFGSTGTSAFGQPQQPQQQAQQTTTFGLNTQQPATGTFGATTFGAKTPIFGQTPTTTQPAAGGFGTFGQQPQAQQPQQQASTGLFGANTGGGLFGQNNQQQQQQPPAQQTSIFGAPAAQQNTLGGGLFGANNQQQQQQQQQQQGGGLFGLKPAAPAGQTGGIFGGGFGQNTTTQPSLFGQQQSAGNTLFGASQQQAPTMGASQSTNMGTSLFGGGGAGVGGGGFGQSGMFGASTAAGTAQGTLTASINQPIGANLPIFSMLPPGPRSVSLDQGQPKKKTGFFVDVPTRSPVPRVQLGFTPANSKLRGFGTSVSSSNLGSGMSALSFSSGRPNALSMDASMTSDALTGGRASPALGSGGRQSVKKLILDKKVEPTDLFSRSGSASPGLRGRVTFNPALSVAAREKDAAAPAAIEAPTPVLARNPRTPNRFTAPSTTHTALDGDIDSGTLKEGDYWSSPDLNTLMNAGHAQLRSCEGLVIGRVGYGEVHFLEPVDLTGLSKLGQLYGEVVRFDDKECSVYPDVDDTEKPAVGTYLNVHARIILLRCWPNDKATREPIKDEKHPAVVRHIKKLKGMRDTDFEGFEMDEGKWTFTVDHF